MLVVLIGLLDSSMEKVRLVLTVLALLLALGLADQCQAQQQVEINAAATTSPFPHFWEEMFGSGRAILALRESYRNDLRAVKQATGFRYVRFHGILDDEVGVYKEDEHGNPVYNFAYVDEIYDGLLKNGASLTAWIVIVTNPVSVALPSDTVKVKLSVPL